MSYDLGEPRDCRVDADSPAKPPRLGLAPEGVDLVFRTVAAILQRAVEGDRLTFDEGVALLLERATSSRWARPPTPSAAGCIPSRYRTYNIDRNINYTNVCTAVCDFCAFYRKVGDTDAYVLDRDVLLKKIEETVALGGDQILMQGGLHPELPLEWYEELLRDIKAHFPQVNIHGFSPPEIHFFHKKFKLPSARRAGAAEGGGAGQPARRGRRDPGRSRPQGDDQGQGADRRLAERPSRLARAGRPVDGHDDVRPRRDAGRADRAPGTASASCRTRPAGFTAFISWTFQPEHTEMADVPAAGAFEYLKTQAISRLYLDNFPNIQSSWVTQGAKIGQLALFFGANDMGSLMIEENVVSSAGTVHHLTLEEIKRAIREAGYVPRQRNVFYEYIDADPGRER